MVKGASAGYSPVKIRVKVGEIRLNVVEFGDDQTHLQTPVAKVDVTDGVVAEVLVQPLQALADDGGAQVADVQGLC